MHILIADDDPITREFLQATLEGFGYQVSACADGWQAAAALSREPRPVVALLDWLMPGLDGLEVCRAQRSDKRGIHTYCILLTSKGDSQDVVAGLEAGADDYVTKPFEVIELHARIRAGARLVELQAQLEEKVVALEAALSQVRRLQGLLPICSYCKRIRDDRDYWQQIEAYISEHSEAQFSHGICPECFEAVVRPQMARAHLRRRPPEENSAAPAGPAGPSGRSGNPEPATPEALPDSPG